MAGGQKFRADNNGEMDCRWKRRRRFGMPDYFVTLTIPANTPQTSPVSTQIEIEGDSRAVKQFIGTLKSSPPPLSRIYSIETKEVLRQNEKTFHIRQSSVESVRVPLITPDSDVCKDCLRELFDPSDRRYQYPFIN